jgi:imidazolonepropionase-like amidohydrolase
MRRGARSCRARLRQSESPFDGWVEIVDDKIAAVGRGRRQAGAGQAVIEGGGRALIPGLVNTRTPIRASRAAAPRA